AGLARDACSHNHHIGALDFGVAVRPPELSVKSFDRPRLRDIERLSLRQAFNNVEHDDIAEFFQPDEMSQSAADLAGANQRDFVAGHESSCAGNDGCTNCLCNYPQATLPAPRLKAAFP